MSIRRKTGFTLVELLVVIAIIGVLVALLLPAVQAAREAARRAQCSNNLKQIALASHNYHDIHQSFPTGQIGFNSPGWGWGWSAMVLPQMEQSAISDQIDFGQPMAAPLNIDLVRTPLASFLCPSATGIPARGVPTGNPSGSGAFEIANPGVAPSSYMGNGGAFENSFNPNEPVDRRNGVLIRDSGIKMRDITDGTSNTILVGEAIYYDFLWDPKLYGNARSNNGRPDATLALIRIGVQRINPPWNASQVVRRESFASYHPGGAMFALCDGTVRFISETIHHTGHSYAQWLNDKDGLGTFQRLTARNDGLPVSEF